VFSGFISKNVAFGTWRSQATFLRCVARFSRTVSPS